MNLSDLRTRLTDLYGPAATNEESYYNRIINDAYKELAAITRWWWLEKETIVTTKAVATTITVDTTDGSTNLDFTATSTTLDDAYDGGWLHSGEHTYRIIDASDSVGEIVIDSDWIESSDSDASVSVWNDIFDLPSDYDDIIDVIPRSEPNYRPLRQITPQEMFAYGIDVYDNATEHANVYCIFRESDKSIYSRIRISPPPSLEVEYAVRYVAFPAAMSLDADIPLLPEKHHMALAYLSRLRLLKDRREDPDVIGNAEIDAQRALQRLWREQKRSGALTYRAGRKGIRKNPPLEFNVVDATSESP